MATAKGPLTPAQQFGRIFGVVYIAVGVAGFFVASKFIGEAPDDILIAFPVNHMHNIIHIVIGLGLLVGFSRADLAPKMNLAVGIVLALVAVLGFIGVLTPELINDQGVADDFLHLGTAILAIYFGTAGATSTGAASTSAEL